MIGAPNRMSYDTGYLESGWYPGTPTLDGDIPCDWSADEGGLVRQPLHYVSLDSE